MSDEPKQKVPTGVYKENRMKGFSAKLFGIAGDESHILTSHSEHPPTPNSLVFVAVTISDEDIKCKVSESGLRIGI